MQTEKKCFKCGVVKPMADYYVHPQMKDGYLNKCKECAKADSTARRMSKLDEVRAYDRERATRPERRKQMAAVTRRLRRENPERVRAHNAVARAVRSGRLLRGPCSVCGTAEDVHAHHDDYSKPMMIEWLCNHHHRVRHGKHDQMET